ncbi:MAG: DNA internalization-related competence protein ComEC/Rec2 [Gammaproteobacteria bacterium]|nr:DNA internalization-related competence protein ComEC/Rec2 [Gammaproteobacteria bacterium]
MLLISARRPKFFRCVLFCIVGCCLCWLHSWGILKSQIDHSMTNRDVSVVGRIADIPTVRGRLARIIVDDLRFAESLAGAPQKILLSWYSPSNLPKAGEYWRFTVRLRRPRGFANPGTFDYEAWLFQQRIGATGYIRSAPPPARLAETGLSLAGIRGILAERIRHAAGGSGAEDLLMALVIGFRGELAPSRWRVLENTGTQHLLAISGLHIGMVAALSFWIVSFCWRKFPSLIANIPVRVAAAVGALPPAVIYAGLAGLTLPTQRALLMLVIACGAIILRVPVAAGDLLGLVLIVILLFDPIAVLSPGFWLSFAAVAILIYQASDLSVNLRKLRLVTAQVILFAGLLPLTLFFFQRLPMMAPLVNLAVIPLFSFLIVPAALLGTALISIEMSGGDFILYFAGRMLAFVWQGMSAAADTIPVWYFPSPGWAQLAFSVVGIFLLLLPQGSPGRKIALLFFLPALVARQPVPDEGAFRFWLLDVGQGLAAVIQTRNHVLLYDTGPSFSSGSDTGKLVVVPMLRSKGLSPDRIIISHNDNDHAGGLQSVREVFPKAMLYTPRDIVQGGEKITPCRSGEQWVWDGVSFEILHPGNIASYSRNNSSCVLRVRTRGGSLLLTGDIEAEVERRLVRTMRDKLASRILVVPHHGSGTSSTGAFIQAVRPEFALVSAGFQNRWGFPKAEVTERYRRHGVHVLNTAASGALEYQVDQAGVRLIREERRANLRLWRAD